ncbi:hypothetical protein GWI33_002445 [Rhynchophorus ferrugineus]|uniref:Uncharacterized protein n=1 Tax=Rhynchophorus ferrugineus TaxID=354439 RepID=A0A834IZL0_RHYFE|nr:hypothetical protein GWI33_002445 [Rhynchophorus ferrugineus]
MQIPSDFYDFGDCSAISRARFFFPNPVNRKQSKIAGHVAGSLDSRACVRHGVDDKGGEGCSHPFIAGLL